MFDLFYSEIKRFQNYALTIAILALALLCYLSSIEPFIAKGTEVDAYTLLTIIGSLAFAVTQMLLHKRKNHWAYLVHRPISTTNIHTALTGAGCLLIIVSFIIPVVLTLVGLDIFNIALLEARHYLFAVHLLLAALFAYYVGVYAILNPTWGALLTIALLYYILPAFDVKSASLALSIDIGFLLAAYYLSKQSFKGNLAKHFTKKRDLFLATAIMHFAVLGLLFMSQMFFYHLPLVLVDSHPDSYSQEQLKGYYASLWSMDKSELTEFIVDESLYPDKKTLVKQIELASEGHIRAGFDRPETLGQIFHYDKSYAFTDKKNKTRWTFSHQEQLFVGQHISNKSIMGYFDTKQFYDANVSLKQIEQDHRFKSVPEIIQNKFIQTEKTVYVVDFSEQYIEIKHQLAEDEYYTRALQVVEESPSIALLTNKSIYLFDRQTFDQENSYEEPDMVIEHYRQIDNQKFISLYSVIDGYIVHYYSSAYFGFGKPGTGLVYAKFDGSRTFLGEQSFLKYRPNPNFIDYQYEWMSPIFAGVITQYLTNQLKDIKDPQYKSFKEIALLPYPGDVYYYALACMLFSMLLTCFIAQKIKLPRSRQVFWLLMIVIFSLPGLVSFLLLNRWKAIVFSKRPARNEENKYVKNQLKQDSPIITNSIK